MARVYSMVSVILLDGEWKWICCFLCIYLRPVKANILGVVVFHACERAKKGQVIEVEEEMF